MRWCKCTSNAIYCSVYQWQILVCASDIQFSPHRLGCLFSPRTVRREALLYAPFDTSSMKSWTAPGTRWLSKIIKFGGFFTVPAVRLRVLTFRLRAVWRRKKCRSTPWVSHCFCCEVEAACLSPFWLRDRRHLYCRLLNVVSSAVKCRPGILLIDSFPLVSHLLKYCCRFEVIYCILFLELTHNIFRPRQSSCRFPRISCLSFACFTLPFQRLLGIKTHDRSLPRDAVHT